MELRKNQCCGNPNSSNQFLYLQAIQGHSGDNAVDPALQDNVLLPKGLTECIYHVGNTSDLNSIKRNGPNPGGKSLKRGRQAVFFTTVNAREDENSMEETPRDLTKPRVAPYKNTSETPSKYCILVQYSARSRRRLAILPNADTCSRSLQHSTCSLH